jgi:hypothetical protein
MTAAAYAARRTKLKRATPDEMNARRAALLEIIASAPR